GIFQCAAQDATFGLLLTVFVVCGLALLGLLSFVSWKLCWVPWRTKAHFSSPSLKKVKDPLGSMGFLEAAVKISHTSPDIPTDVQLSMREHFLRRTQRMQRQTTEPASSTRLVTDMLPEHCSWCSC
uniref:Uncharacterized protein n=1 Tax=Acanthochromis polyacanthus TaxID=80966 RepID=A0A3Q1GJ32_9TELE